MTTHLCPSHLKTWQKFFAVFAFLFDIYYHFFVVAFFLHMQTRVGPVLITFNPHRGIPIQQAFQYSQLGQNLPLSQLATNVISNLHDNGSSQAIILL